MHHSRVSVPKGNDSQTKIRHKTPARNQSCGMPLLTASSTAADRNKPAQLSLWSWSWAMGRQDVWGWLRGKDFFFSSVKTSSFITDKSDRWKPIKKKSYSQVPGFSGEVLQFFPLLCSNCWVLTQGKPCPCGTALLLKQGL